MTVKELIEKLQQFDPELEVDSEGCDCIEPALDCYVYDKEVNPRVLVARSNEYIPLVWES